MAFTSISSSLISAGKAITASLLQTVKDDLDWLYGQIGTLGSSGLMNGSFEIDSNSDGYPDNWTWSAYAGGSGAIDTTNVAHGANSFKMVHPGGGGNGGGTLTSDYVPWSEVYSGINVLIGFSHYATNAMMKNKITVNYYTKAKVFISASDAYVSVDNPTSWTYFMVPMPTCPAGTCFIKIIVNGGDSSVNKSGSAYFDGIFLIVPKFTAAGILTVAEGGTSAESYADLNSGYIISAPYGYQGGSISITVPVQNRWDNVNTSTGCRIKVVDRTGTPIYSNVKEPPTSNSYNTDNFTVTGNNLQFPCTVILQGKGVGGSSATFAKCVSEACTATLS